MGRGRVEDQAARETVSREKIARPAALLHTLSYSCLLLAFCRVNFDI